MNVGAESVRNGLWDRAPYNVGKGGVHALTTSIAREVADTGITCNCVAPGGTNSQASRVTARVRLGHRRRRREPRTCCGNVC